MNYTLQAGVDRQIREKVPKSILYGTGVVVIGLLLILPFTGNNTFWMGGSNGQGTNANNGSNSSNDKSYTATASTSKDSKSSGSSAPTATGGGTSTSQPTSSQTADGVSIIATPSPAPSASSIPVVGRGGDATDPKATTPGTVTVPTDPATTPALPLTVCTPTISMDPLLNVGAVCAN